MHISLIVPIYGAESFLRSSLQEINAFLAQRPEQWELLLVIDASPDRSAAICQEFAAQAHPYQVRVVINEKNLGKGGTVKRGMLEATGHFRIFIDCDLAYPMSDVARVLDALQSDQDVAIASRVHPESVYTIRPSDFHYLYTRHLSSRLFNFVLNHTLLRGWSDTQAGLKGFTDQAAEFIFSQTRLTGFSFDVEVLYLADRANLKTTEVPIYFRYAQEPSTMDFLSDALRMLRDIYRVYRWGVQGQYRFVPKFHAPRNLVIHADDFGLSQGITEGIGILMEKGAVTAASIMPNFPDSAEALRLARENKWDVGWHVTLTLGTPVSDPTTIPSLVQANGHFYPLRQFLQRALLRQIKAADVQRELSAQWQVFVDAGLRPSHVDGHQHCHVFPVVRDQVYTLVSEHAIPFVRLPVETGGIFKARFWARTFLRSFKGSRPSFWRGSGCQHAPFYGLSFAFHAGQLAAWRQLLGQIHEDGAEVMVHPGIMRPGEDLYGDDFPGNRQDELNILLSPEWRQLLSEFNFQLNLMQTPQPD